MSTLPGKPGKFHLWPGRGHRSYSHVTSMPVLIRQANNFLGQVIRSASEGKYNTVNSTTSGKVTFQKCLNSGITYFHLKIATSYKHSPLVPTRAYMKLGRAA